MAARNQQSEIGKVQPLGQPAGERMGLEVIDGDEGLVGRERQRLGRGEADENAADEARAGGSRYGVDAGDIGSRRIQRTDDQPLQHIDMGAGGDLRHDAAIGRVLGDLAHHLIGENVPAIAADARGHDGDRRLVAGGFNAENAHGRVLERRRTNRPAGGSQNRRQPIGARPGKANRRSIS